MDWGVFSGDFFSSEIWKNVFAPLLGLVTVTGVVIAIIKFFLNKIRDLERKIWSLEQEFSKNVSKTALLEDTIASGDTLIAKYHKARGDANSGELTLWERPIGIRLESYDERLRDSKPIMLFANLKGGVAKTTLSANIGAYFAKKGEQVLLIDLDYQVSLSGLCLSQGQYTDFPSLTDHLIDGSADGNMSANYAKPIGVAATNLHFIPAFHQLEATENKLMFQWFLRDRNDDIRYNLASVLLSDEIQNRFDRIILDGPPRMTPALVNALCASTHLFIPTVLDNLSAETVGSFSDKIHKLRGPVMPHLKLSGIIGTMAPRPELSDTAINAATLAESKACEALGGYDYFMWDAFLRKSANISNTTDEGIAYLQDSQTHELFDPIGAEIARRTT